LLTKKYKKQFSEKQFVKLVLKCLGIDNLTHL